MFDKKEKARKEAEKAKLKAYLDDQKAYAEE
jgi:hypothetical protein